MKRHNILLLWLIAMVLTGCPYETEVSLGTPLPIDSVFLGQWNGNNVEFINDEWTIKVIDFNENEFLLDIDIKEDGKLKKRTARAFTTRMGSENILHVQYISFNKGKRTYKYFTYLIKDDVLEVRFLLENSETENLKFGKDLYEYVMRNLKNEEAWSASRVFVKEST